MLNMPRLCSLWLQKQIGTGSGQRNGNGNETFALLQIVPAAGCNAATDVLCLCLVTEYSSFLETVLFTEEHHSSV